MRNPVFAFTAILALCACGSREQPAAPAAAATDAPAAAPQGAPHIAIAPDGVHVQYRVYGGGEPLLVFIHGWSCDSNYWRAQVPEFARRYTVVTVDLAGHGGTDGNRSEWSIARFGQDVATALSAVPGSRVILVGHSMGGPVALEAARLLKGRVIGVVGVDTFNTIGAPPPTRAQVQAIMKPFEADFIGHTRRLVTEHLFEPGANQELANKVAYDMSLSSPRVAIPSLRALIEYDYGAALEELSIPIVAIDSDLGEPVNEARIRKALPKFHLTTIEGVGHFLMMEDPARFNAALENEVQALGAGASS